MTSIRLLSTCAFALLPGMSLAQGPLPTASQVPAATVPATKPDLGPRIVLAKPAPPAVRPRAKARRPIPPAIRRVAAANRNATSEPSAQGFINANQVYTWSEGGIYQAYAAPGSVTDIALQAGESLVAVAAGDTVRWIIGDTTSGSGADKRTHILAKPVASGLATNLLITTDRRSYHLKLVSTRATAMVALSWIYPQDELIALRRTAVREEAAAPIAADLSIEALNFGYDISGDRPAWRPLRAFDDERQTFIEFPASIAVGEAPPLFVVGREGAAELVNYRVRGRFYVVDRLFDAAELRLGQKKQDVVRIARGPAGQAGRRRKAA